ncbi:MAG: uroporphyrinogen-III synthase [Thermoanaerobaculales bacterium]
MSRFVLITRLPSDCGELQALIEPFGLKLQPYPVLRLAPFKDEEGWRKLLAVTRDSGEVAWVILASPRAADPFVRACRQRGADQLLNLPVAAVGESTARSAIDAGLRVEEIGPGTGSGLAGQLAARLSAPTSVVFACGREHRPEMPDALAAAGHTVLPVAVYGMDPTPPSELPPAEPNLEAVVLTSPRAAALYLEGIGGRPLPCPHWALGPTTRDAAAAIGIECAIPRKPNLETLAEELCRN